jgi:hypothetical protein
VKNRMFRYRSFSGIANQWHTIPTIKAFKLSGVKSKTEMLIWPWNWKKNENEIISMLDSVLWNRNVLLFYTQWSY